MEYTVDESNAWTLVWVLIGQLYMDLPETTSEWRYSMVSDADYWITRLGTYFLQVP